MPNAKKLPSGSWRVLLYCGKDAQGKRVYQSVTAATKRQAEMDAALLSHQKKHEKPSPLTVGQAIDRYIESKNHVLSPKTIREYLSMRRAALQGIMDIPAESLTTEQLQVSVNQYAAAHAPKTVRNAVALLVSALGMFLPDKRLRVSLPRPRKPDIAIPTDDQLKSLIGLADPTLKTAILLASALGLRRSEICALTWADLDTKHATLRVNKAMVYTELNTWQVKGTKTSDSARTLDLPPFLLDHLKALPRDNDRIIPKEPDHITYRFMIIRNKAGISIRFHDLRHYYASLLLALGVPDKYAMKKMGHATPNMLKNVYQHLRQDKQDEINDQINAALKERFS